jgi:heterodisulfide reductase subunit A
METRVRQANPADPDTTGPKNLMRGLKVENELLLEEKIQQLSKSLGDSNFGDVMVVGGGISGIQASLDLATAGFKVYLVEKGPSIGGHMAQLDKTFPTNDCSM